MDAVRLYGNGWPTHRAKARGRAARHRARRRLSALHIRQARPDPQPERNPA